MDARSGSDAADASSGLGGSDDVVQRLAPEQLHVARAQPIPAEVLMREPTACFLRLRGVTSRQRPRE
jgi:hypothetical protein